MYFYYDLIEVDHEVREAAFTRPKNKNMKTEELIVRVGDYVVTLESLGIRILEMLYSID